MACGTPEDYPGILNVVELATQQSMFDPKKGISYMLTAVGELPDNPAKEDYVEKLKWSFANEHLANPVLSSDQKIEIFKELYPKPSIELANALADVGKDWSLEEDEDDREIGLKLLSLSADTFEKVVSAFDESTPIEERYKVVVEDYARVVSLQDEAKDNEGATRTSVMVAPHLIALASLGLDRDEKSFLSQTQVTVSDFLGERYPELRSHLVATMTPESKKRAETNLKNSKLTEILKSATEENVTELLKSFGDEPGFDFWHDLWKLVQEGETDTESMERAQWFVEKIDSAFPSLFEEADERLLTMVPVEQILYFTNRDDLLAKYYKSTVAGNSIHMMSKFAGECAHTGQIKRLQSMAEAMGLAAEQNRALFQMYEEGCRQKEDNK